MNNNEENEEAKETVSEESAEDQQFDGEEEIAEGEGEQVSMEELLTMIAAAKDKEESEKEFWNFVPGGRSRSRRDGQAVAVF